LEAWITYETIDFNPFSQSFPAVFSKQKPNNIFKGFPMQWIVT